MPRRVVLPKAFKLARQSSGLTQRALATKASVSESLVAMIEVGARSPGPMKATQLAVAMGVDVEAFMVDR